MSSKNFEIGEGWRFESLDEGSPKVITKILKNRRTGEVTVITEEVEEDEKKDE